MIVLFMVVSFVIGCVSYSFQNVFFFNYSFWPCHYGFLTFPCLWEIRFLVR